MNGPNELWTIGHSRHSLEEFIGALKNYQIEAVADVRRFPISTRFPHFSQMALFKSLIKSGIEYVHIPELGGRRRALVDSPNTRWRNASFRGFADYMQTKPFEDGIEKLMELAAQKRTAVLCAEAIWWRCHRALISDYLKVSGIRVLHILPDVGIQEHPYTSAARVIDNKLSYAPEPALELAW